MIMKNFILLLTVAFFGITSFAQEAQVILDTVDPDGQRTVGTNRLVVSNMSDDITLYIALLYVGDPAERSESAWGINVSLVSTSSFSLPEDSLMLIKLDNDEIIEVEQICETYETEDRVGEYDRNSKTRLYTMNGTYQISEDNIKKILSHSVAKVRVIRNINPIDYTYDSDIFTSALREEYDLISSAISVEKTTYSDF